jgi:hypothetical protein
MFMHGVGHPDVQSSISQAIWYLTANAVTPGTILWASLDSGAQTLVTYVTTHTLPALSTYADLWLYTQPFAPPAMQEMWGQVPVPEGGAALMYLLLAGVTCFGAMFYSRRRTAMGGLAWFGQCFYLSKGLIKPTFRFAGIGRSEVLWSGQMFDQPFARSNQQPCREVVLPS